MGPKIHAEIEGNRIATRSPWYPKAAAEAKSVPGYSWNKSAKAWTYPLDYQTCLALRRIYGDRLVIGPELWAWAAEEKARRSYLSEASKRMDAEIYRVPEISPRLAEAMGSRTYQRSGAAFGAVAGSVLFADQPSLGKTSMALATLMEADAWKGRHLVIAPKTSLATVWKRWPLDGRGGCLGTGGPEGPGRRSRSILEPVRPRRVLVHQPGHASDEDR